MKPLLTKLKVPLAIFIGTLLLRLLHMTLRWRVSGHNGALRPEQYDQPLNIVFWHCRQLIMVTGDRPLFHYQKRRPIHVLSSQHGDGRIVAGIARQFNLRNVFGSSTRGGVGGTKALVERVKSGSHISITPDGPRGPRHILKEGAVKVSQLSGAPIIPLGVAASRCWQLSSWDRMLFPKPFAKIIILVGDSIAVPADASDERLEELRMQAETALNELTAEAERQAGA